MNINLSILKNKNFLLYSTSQWINSLGDAVFVIALTWLLVQSTGSPVVVGSYLFILGIVKSIFILFGGVIVDQVDSRRLMIFSDLARGVLMFLFFILNLNSIPPIWIFYLIAVVFGMVDSVAEPAEITSGTRIVDKGHYSQSLSILMVTGNVSTIIGPMLGAWLFYLGGPQTAIFTNGISYIISIILLLFVRFRQTESKNDQTVGGILLGLLEGFNCFIKTKIIIVMALQTFFTNAAVSATVVAVPFLLRDMGYGVWGS
ncbi:MFS transporter [Sporolactobacillus shoreae]|uniref:MFS transporter n=1 Tax=Sporolactobacillus shoreae TaxID=1465501 RepID=A0A4Z0GJA2_9BACL|nr:MFS transporter [Sporolactobacillus shoreae]TGA95929.1 MFS transporter [Sporolactobacillus shoreae]